MHGSPPRILYLAHRVPYPPDKGDRIRTYQILRWLAGRGVAVHLACLADEAVDPSVPPALGEVAERVAVIPISRRARRVGAFRSLALGGTATAGAFASRPLNDLLDAWGRQTRYHVAIASASSMVPYLRRPALQGTPAVIDLMDVDSQKWFDYAAASRGPLALLYRLEGRRLRRTECALVTWARGLILSSPAEEALFRGFAGDGPIRSVNNGVDLDYFQPDEAYRRAGGAPASGGQGCAFVGALEYRPNVDAACWFAREVWPEVVRRRPGARLRLVGRRPAPAVAALRDLPGVEVVGQVPDVRPSLRQATVVVAPLRIARGVQNKVLEGLAMAKATVVSPAALCGVRARPGVHLLAATTPPEWIEAVLGLFDDAALRTRLGDAGRRYVEENHRWERCLEPLAEFLDLPAARGAGGSPAVALHLPAARELC